MTVKTIITTAIVKPSNGKAFVRPGMCYDKR